MQYTADDRAEINRELRKKGIVFGIAGLIIACGAGVLFAARMQLWTSVLTIVAGAPYLFLWAVFMSPPLKYRRMLNEFDKGQQRVSHGEFVRVESAIIRDGLLFMPFIVASESDGEIVERRLYWDEHKPIPAFNEGERLEIITFGQTIKAVKKL